MILKKYKNGRLVSTSTPTTPDPAKKNKLPTIFRTLKNKSRITSKPKKPLVRTNPQRIRRKTGCGCGR